MVARVYLCNQIRDYVLFLSASLIIFFLSILLEFKLYKEFTVFDSTLVKATVLKQYLKSKNNRTYQVLKLKTQSGLTFYTTAKRSLQDLHGKNIELEIWPKELDFHKYLSTFYARSKILTIENGDTIRDDINSYISSAHENQYAANIYKALYTATPLDKELQKSFSNLGISHLLAISGFHLGVLSAILLFLIRPVYTFAQDRLFPYRNSKLDIFLFVSLILFVYLVFLDSPPSLLRSFAMLVIGFILYDRGIKIISMQTLFLTLVLLLSFFPRLLFMNGFWLSAAGVFFIFLFLDNFKHLNKSLQFMLLPVWVYLTMLPLSLALFHNFSIYHPLSILWSILFTLFYPLSIFLHVIGQGDIFDPLLIDLIGLGATGSINIVGIYLFTVYVLISFASVFYRYALYMLILLCLFLFIDSVYYIT